MSFQESCSDTPNATSSPESEAGPLRCSSQDGPLLGRSGLDHVRASLSARQANKWGLLTSGTFGLRSSTSSTAAALQSSWVSRLQGPDGLVWLDLVQADLEGAGYACRAADLCAAGVGAPHLRQRLYWVADLHNTGLERWQLGGDRAGEWPAGASGLVDWVADPADGSGQRGEPRAAERIDAQGAGTLQTESASGPLYGFWGAADWLFCKDGKWRPVEPGTQPLAYGVPARVGRLRGYGNAIVSQVAAKFIQSLGAQA